MKLGNPTAVPMDARIIVWAETWPVDNYELDYCEEYAQALAESVRYCTVRILGHKPGDGMPSVIAKATYR